MVGHRRVSRIAQGDRGRLPPPPPPPVGPLQPHDSSRARLIHVLLVLCGALIDRPADFFFFLSFFLCFLVRRAQRRRAVPRRCHAVPLCDPGCHAGAYPRREDCRAVPAAGPALVPAMRRVLQPPEPGPKGRSRTDGRRVRCRGHRWRHGAARAEHRHVSACICMTGAVPCGCGCGWVGARGRGLVAFLLSLSPPLPLPTPPHPGIKRVGFGCVREGYGWGSPSSPPSPSPAPPGIKRVSLFDLGHRLLGSPFCRRRPRSPG